MSALSDLLNARLPEGTSKRQIAQAILHDPAHDVSDKTIYPYFNDGHGQPELKTLRALAAHLPGVKLGELVEAAGLPDVVGPYMPPDEAEYLSDRQRRALDELIRAMVDRPSTGATVTPLSAATGRPASSRGATGETKKVARGQKHEREVPD